MNKICLHCYVSGRVQGVFYRDGAQRKAKELGITGWVHNMPDGRVEVMACGEVTKVDQFRDWLWEGSPRADVTDVTIDEVTWTDYDDFVTK